MHTILAGWLGGGEMMVVIVVALILFGSKRIPEFAKGLGQAMKEFKKASNDVSNEIHNAMNQETLPPPPPPVKPQAALESGEVHTALVVERQKHGGNAFNFPARFNLAWHGQLGVRSAENRTRYAAIWQPRCARLGI